MQTLPNTKHLKHNNKQHRAGDHHPWLNSGVKEDRDRFRVAPGKRMSWEGCQPSSGKPQTGLSLSLQMLVFTTSSQIVPSNWHIRAPNRHRWRPGGVGGRDNSGQKSNVVGNCKRTKGLLLFFHYYHSAEVAPVSLWGVLTVDSCS